MAARHSVGNQMMSRWKSSSLGCREIRGWGRLGSSDDWTKQHNYSATHAEDARPCYCMPRQMLQKVKQPILISAMTSGNMVGPLELEEANVAGKKGDGSQTGNLQLHPATVTAPHFRHHRQVCSCFPLPHQTCLQLL